VINKANFKAALGRGRARRRGRRTIIKVQSTGVFYVSEPAVQRSLKAMQHRADAVLNPLETDFVAEIRKITSGNGVDVTFNFAGVQASVEATIGGTNINGMVMKAAIWGSLGPR